MDWAAVRSNSEVNPAVAKGLKLTLLQAKDIRAKRSDMPWLPSMYPRTQTSPPTRTAPGGKFETQRKGCPTRRSDPRLLRLSAALSVPVLRTSLCNRRTDEQIHRIERDQLRRIGCVCSASSSPELPRRAARDSRDNRFSAISLTASVRTGGSLPISHRLIIRNPVSAALLGDRHGWTSFLISVMSCR